MRRTAFTALATIYAGALVHCSLLSGLDSLQKVACVDACGDAATVAMTGDGGPIANDGGRDAAADTGVSAGPGADTGTSNESGAGGDSSPGDAGLHFCASLVPQPTLCADFDEGTTFSPQFPQLFQPSVGQLGIDDAASASPPSSMFALVDEGTSGAQAVAYVEHTFSSARSSFELAFDVLVEQGVAGHYGVVASLGLNQASQSPFSLTMAIASTEAEIEQAFFDADGGEQFVDSRLDPAPPMKEWTRVDITVSLGQQTITVLVGGVSALTDGSLDPSWPSSGILSIQLGLTYVASTSSSWVTRIDNVVVNAQ